MLNIAVDGPSGAGKSTIAKIIAKELGIIYLDTGAMYRALGLKALMLGIDPNDEKGVLTFLNKAKIEIKYKEGAQYIFLDGKDVSEKIREHAVSKAASDISKIKEVRLKLVEMQREIARKNDVIMDGRDIGSYVLPKASVKFFLTAPAELRARRRHKELLEKGQNKSLEEILNDIITRDKQDTEREFAPLIKTSDAVEIINDGKTIEEICAEMLKLIRAQGTGNR